MNHGKHVATAVPAVFGSLEEAEQLLEAVKRTGMKYMMFETSVYRPDCYAMRTLYNAGKFGNIIYSEGEYYHYSATPIDSYKGWRVGMPPLWYPTHSTAYLTGVSGEHFTEVSCMGMPGELDYLQPENNPYKNPFGTEIALLRTSGGGMSRMLMSKDTPGYHGEQGRVRGQHGCMTGTTFEGTADITGIEIAKPPLPPGVQPGGHGGSHGYLSDEFIRAIIEDRKPLIDVISALNMTVPGVVAHESALKDGELLKIPVYEA
jgi:predicted dehydrogenase